MAVFRISTFLVQFAEFFSENGGCCIRYRVYSSTEENITDPAFYDRVVQGCGPSG